MISLICKSIVKRSTKDEFDRPEEISRELRTSVAKTWKRGKNMNSGHKSGGRGSVISTQAIYRVTAHMHIASIEQGVVHGVGQYLRWLLWRWCELARTMLTALSV